MEGIVRSVNTGRIDTLVWDGRARRTAFCKTPVEGRVAVTRLGLAGDERAWKPAVNDPDHAVYAYATEDYAWWAEQESRPFPPAMLGENLTLEGIDVSGAAIGERWRVGTVVLEVCKPRIACAKMAARMQDGSFVRRFGRAGRPGAYLRVIEEGSLGAGDEVAVLERPDHGVNVALVSRAVLGDHTLAARLLEAQALSAGMREWAERRVSEGGG